MTQLREAFFPYIKYMTGRRKDIFLEKNPPLTVFALCHQPLKFFFNRGLPPWNKAGNSMARIKSQQTKQDAKFQVPKAHEVEFSNS